MFINEDGVLIEGECQKWFIKFQKKKREKFQLKIFFQKE